MTLIRQRLRELISQSAFAKCRFENDPPYETFLDVAANAVAHQFSPDADIVCASISKFLGRYIWVDGQIRIEEETKDFSVHAIWRVESQQFRFIRASAREPNPVPGHKSLEQFVAEINAIREDDDTDLRGQAFDAVEGVDEESKEFPRTYAAIFALFERFPEEDFGNPGSLVHMMEARGEYEDELVQSLQRVPSIPTVTMLVRIINGATEKSIRDRWIRILKEIVASEVAHEDVRWHATEAYKFVTEGES